jgi:NADPH2:quinone reductase
MKAVVITKAGGPEVLQVQEVPPPELKPNEVMLRVKAAGINGADKMQRRGQYPVPPGELTSTLSNSAMSSLCLAGWCN